MQTPEKDGPIRPVLIFNQENDLLSCALINDKGYAKSLEQRELWTLDGKSGRLLPWPGGGEVLGIADEGAWVSVNLGGASLERLDSTPLASPSGREPDPEVSLGRGEGLLLELEALIRKRKEEMPEGSYTTHLFARGEQKIRKKLGEEAVELVLAEEEKELASEAADLLYHMMVLLVERGIPFRKVLEELASR